MYVIESQEQVDWLLNGIENGEIAFDNRKRTEEEWEEIRNEIAEYKAMRQKNEIKEAVLVR